MTMLQKIRNIPHFEMTVKLAKPLICKKAFAVIIAGVTVTFLIVSVLICNSKTMISCTHYRNLKSFIAGEIVDFSVADNITGFPYAIVPNWVHFIKFRNNQLSFTEMVNIRAAHQIQKPERLIIHCDCNHLTGKYWDMLHDIKEIEIKYLPEPTHIFGKKLGNVHHASDVARIRMMMKYGGIFLDNDVYLVRSLDSFRKFEFAIGWDEGQFMGTQVLIAHHNARLFRLWLEGYKRYRPDLWYYNAGELPTVDFLYKDPSLVHRVKLLFGVHMLVHNLYKGPWPEWKNQYSVHLLMRHRSYLDKESPIKEFDEFNIKTYNQTWGQMARLTLFGSMELLPGA